MIETNLGKVRPDVLKEAIGVIADVVEVGANISSGQKAALMSLCKSLPPEFAGESSRLLELLEGKKA